MCYYNYYSITTCMRKHNYTYYLLYTRFRWRVCVLMLRSSKPLLHSYPRRVVQKKGVCLFSVLYTPALALHSFAVCIPLVRQPVFVARVVVVVGVVVDGRLHAPHKHTRARVAHIS